MTDDDRTRLERLAEHQERILRVLQELRDRGGDDARSRPARIPPRPPEGMGETLPGLEQRAARELGPAATRRTAELLRLSLLSLETADDVLGNADGDGPAAREVRARMRNHARALRMLTEGLEAELQVDDALADGHSPWDADDGKQQTDREPQGAGSHEAGGLSA